MRPTFASSSARKRSSVSEFEFMALAINMLPTGMSEAMRGSIAPSHVIRAITKPEPPAMP